MVVLFVEFLIGIDKNAAFYLNNVLMLGFFVWQIHDGISEKNKSNFMWGVFGVMLLALGRYISLIDDYVTSSIIFMFAGIGLFFINRFWNKKFGGNS
jgi:membrane-bound ClpP family serine protease